MAFIKDEKGNLKFKGIRVLIDADTYDLILSNKVSDSLFQRYGFTYAVKSLVHKALDVPAPDYPSVAMSLGGKKSRALAAKKKKVSRKRVKKAV
jgi:hypothetical protein